MITVEGVIVAIAAACITSVNGLCMRDWQYWVTVLCICIIILC